MNSKRVQIDIYYKMIKWRKLSSVGSEDDQKLQNIVGFKLDRKKYKKASRND